MKKILVMLFIAIIAMAGTASAYQAVLYDAAGNNVAANPVLLKPGESIVLSYYASSIIPAEYDEFFEYTVEDISVRAGSPATASASDVTIEFDTAYTPDGFIPGGASYMDTGVITVSLDENAPEGARYYIEVGAGGETVEFQTASRTIETIPEFPTIALPVAAIIGLAFFMQRRKEE
nr:PEF-CTERM sorting domain-containing protein [uncultured Methanolobus sp.]